MRYTPSAVVTSVKVPPREVLFASTVTPGSTAPDASLMVPSILPVCSCATAPNAVNRTRAMIEANPKNLDRVRTISLLSLWNRKTWTLGYRNDVPRSLLDFDRTVTSVTFCCNFWHR
jgi:hypothetical protein